MHFAFFRQNNEHVVVVRSWSFSPRCYFISSINDLIISRCSVLCSLFEIERKMWTFWFLFCFFFIFFKTWPTFHFNFKKIIFLITNHLFPFLSFLLFLFLSSWIHFPFVFFFSVSLLQFFPKWYLFVFCVFVFFFFGFHFSLFIFYHHQPPVSFLSLTDITFFAANVKARQNKPAILITFLIHSYFIYFSSLI